MVKLVVEQPVDESTVKKVTDRSKESYPHVKDQKTLGVHIDMQKESPQFRFMDEDVAFRLSSEDSADILIVSSHGIVSSRLAPYPGWEEFRDRAQHDWKTWKRVAGYQKITRIGVRYINRVGQEWARAKELVKECRAIEKYDLGVLYDLYDERLDEYIADPPPSDRDGVYVATSK